MVKEKFFYKWAPNPLDEHLVTATLSAAEFLFDKLIASGADGPVMDAYYRERYYAKHLNHLAGKLQCCAYHVMWALSDTHKKLEETTLIDHGCGLGLVGLVAKKMGVGRVICNDIDSKFLAAAKGIGQLVRAEADEYIQGDLGALIEALGQTKTDALVSYDVLEHIYDLDDFLNTLCTASCCPEKFFMSSGANMFSPIYVRNVLPIQRRCEAENFDKRVEIIRECSASLSEDQVKQIARKTRICIREEIEETVKHFELSRQIVLPKKTGVNAYDPYGSNTVDPNTGWWAEHLFNPLCLTQKLKDFGFSARVKGGYYGGRGSFLNPLIRYSGGMFSLPIAQYYTVEGFRKR